MSEFQKPNWYEGLSAVQTQNFKNLMKDAENQHDSMKAEDWDDFRMRVREYLTCGSKPFHRVLDIAEQFGMFEVWSRIKNIERL